MTERMKPALVDTSMIQTENLEQSAFYRGIVFRGLVEEGGNGTAQVACVLCVTQANIAEEEFDIAVQQFIDAANEQGILTDSSMMLGEFNFMMSQRGNAKVSSTGEIDIGSAQSWLRSAGIEV